MNVKRADSKSKRLAVATNLRAMAKRTSPTTKENRTAGLNNYLQNFKNNPNFKTLSKGSPLHESDPNELQGSEDPLYEAYSSLTSNKNLEQMKKLKKSIMTKKNKGSVLVKKERSLTPNQYSNLSDSEKIQAIINYSPSNEYRNGSPDTENSGLFRQNHISKLAKNFISKGSPKLVRNPSEGKKSLIHESDVSDQVKNRSFLQSQTKTDAIKAIQDMQQASKQINQKNIVRYGLKSVAAQESNGNYSSGVNNEGKIRQQGIVNGITQNSNF